MMMFKKNNTLANMRELKRLAGQLPYTPVFVNVVGQHYCGFDSEDSDFELRGAHVIPLNEFCGINPNLKTVDLTRMAGGHDILVLSQDIKTVLSKLVAGDATSLENILSPKNVVSSHEYATLIPLAENSIGKHFAESYVDLAQHHWKLFSSAPPYRIATLLDVFRALFTGIHLMNSGKLIVDINELIEFRELPYVNDMIRRKKTGPDAGSVRKADLPYFEEDMERFIRELAGACEESNLPEEAPNVDAIDEFLINLRLKTKK
jgi:predicted nucleotidyltransferase